MIAMKRIVLLLVVLIFSSSLSANAAAEDSSATSKQLADQKIEQQIYYEGSCYKVLKNIDVISGKIINYTVRIFDTDWNVIYERDFPITPSGGPIVGMLDENILRIKLIIGSGTHSTRFVDRSNSRVSPSYPTPLLVGNGKVVFKKKDKLVVSDMFDQNVYYKEIVFEDFADVIFPVREVKWEGTEKLSITYLTGTRQTGLVEKSVLVDLDVP